MDNREFKCGTCFPPVFFPQPVPLPEEVEHIMDMVAEYVQLVDSGRSLPKLLAFKDACALCAHITSLSRRVAELADQHTVDDVKMLKRCLTLAGESRVFLGGESDQWSHEDVMRGMRKVMASFVRANEFYTARYAEVERRSEAAEEDYTRTSAELQVVQTERESAEAKLTTAQQEVRDMDSACNTLLSAVCAERDAAEAKCQRIMDWARSRCVCCSQDTCGNYGTNRHCNCPDWTPLKAWGG